MDPLEQLKDLICNVENIECDLKELSENLRDQTQLKNMETIRRERSEKYSKKLEGVIEDLLTLLTDILNYSNESGQVNENVRKLFDNRKCVMDQRCECLHYYQPGDIFSETDDVDWQEINGDLGTIYSVNEVKKIGLVIRDIEHPDNILFERKPVITVKKNDPIIPDPEPESVEKEEDNKSEHSKGLIQPSNESDMSIIPDQPETDSSTLCHLTMSDDLEIKCRGEEPISDKHNLSPGEYMLIGYPIDDRVLDLIRFKSKEGDHEIIHNVDKQDDCIKIMFEIPIGLNPDVDDKLMNTELMFYTIHCDDKMQTDGSYRKFNFTLRRKDICHQNNERCKLLNGGWEGKQIYWNGQSIVITQESDQKLISSCQSYVMYENIEIVVTRDVLNERSDKGHLKKVAIEKLFGDNFKEDERSSIIEKMIEDKLIYKDNAGRIHVQP